MDQTLEQLEQAARDAQADLQSLDDELAAIPARLKEAHAETIKARDEKAILERIKTRKRLEERQEVLPILIRHQRIAVLKARADIFALKRELALKALPAARSEEADAKAAFDEAEIRYKIAQQSRVALESASDKSRNSAEMLLNDADALSKGKPTTRYFANSGN